MTPDDPSSFVYVSDVFRVPSSAGVPHKTSSATAEPAGSPTSFSKSLRTSPPEFSAAEALGLDLSVTRYHPQHSAPSSRISTSSPSTETAGTRPRAPRMCGLLLASSMGRRGFRERGASGRGWRSCDGWIFQVITVSAHTWKVICTHISCFRNTIKTQYIGRVYPFSMEI